GCTYESNLPKDIYVPKGDKKIHVIAKNVVDCEEPEPDSMSLRLTKEWTGAAIDLSDVDVNFLVEGKSVEPGATIDVTDYAGSEVSLAERSEEHTSELQSRENLVCRLLLE